MMTNKLPQNAWGILASFIKKHGVTGLAAVVLCWTLKTYHLDPTAARDKLLTDSTVAATASNTESVRMMAESSVDIAESDARQTELMTAMNQKMDLILRLSGGE